MPASAGAKGSTPRWNFFARTLEDLLAAPPRNTPLSQLDNLGERPGEELDPRDMNGERELVHREKLRRLILSLREPGTFPALNRDDVERIARYFHFSDDERRRLSAAMLATYIQRMVYERFSAKRDDEQKRRAAALALRVVESMLPTLEEALAELGEDGEDAFRTGARALASGRDGLEGVVMGDVDSAPDDERVYAALAGALDAVDRATVALQLSYGAAESVERLERARAARDAFSDALERLDDQEAAVRANGVWRIWHDEARRGYDEADERVIDLGG